jgi:gliding motility-associated protein GldE
LDPDPYLQNFAYHFLSTTAAVDISVTAIAWIGIGIVFLLFMSALVSGSEVAFFSLSPNDFHSLSQEDDAVSKRILYLRDRPRTLLATILISNNLINIAIVILTDFFVRATLSDQIMFEWSTSLEQQFYFIGANLIQWSTFIEFVITTVLVTFLLVLFGEITPKIYANLNNIKVARATSFLLFWLNTGLNPLSKILVNGSTFLEQHFSGRVNNDMGSRREEIDRAIDLTVIHEKDAERERSILKGIIKFGDVSVKQIMRARVDIVALDVEADFKEVMRVIRESGYSRMPVYRDDLDTIVGVLYIKDLLGHYNEGQEFNWQSKLREPIVYLPEAKKIDEVLKGFRAQKTHIGIVVDEYGGTSGLVTLEDIMEEVIGEIKDEFDDELEVLYEKKSETEYIFDGKTMINDMCKILNIDTDTFFEIRGDADSVAGLFLEMFGQLPKKNTEVKFNQFIFKVVAVNKTRIEKVQITLLK